MFCSDTTMSLLKKLLFIIFFYETNCEYERLLNKNNKNFNDTTSKIYDVLIKIFKLHKEDYSTVLISSDVEGINLEWLQELHGEISIFSHRNARSFDGNLQHFKKFDAFVFIIEGINIEKLFLDICHNTGWWNVMIPIYILFIEPCDIESIRNIFKLMEGYEILTSYLLFSNADQKVKIYTLNSISNYAPEEWKPVVEIVLHRNSTVFERIDVEGDISHGFYFDRTKNLSDYEIVVASDPEVPYSFLVNKFYDRQILDNYPESLTPLRRMMIDTLATATKARIVIYFHSNQSLNEEYLNFWENYLYAIWYNSSCDIILTLNEMHFEDRHFPFDGSYPASMSEHAIVTYHKGYQTPAEKIRDFYGVWISLFTLFILIATFIVIWFTENKNITFIMFEIIRLLISQGLCTRMNTLSLRIFFGVVLIYFLIIQATFNGHLAEFLTKPQLRRHPDTLQDLQDLGYTEVYDWEGVYRDLAKTPEERGDSVTLTKTCFQYLIYNNTAAACVGEYIEFQNQTYNQKNLYLSKKTFGSFYVQHPIRRGSPLSGRIYQFFLLLGDLGFQQYIHRIVYDKFNPRYKVDEANLDESFRPINLENLIFAFIIFGIGLCFATVIFFIEIIFNFRLDRKIDCLKLKSFFKR